MDLITGDGGFDFSIDFNKQEAYAIRLIFSQISFAITMQKMGGTFILKIFDMFLESTIEMIYLLSTLYKNVIITKPYTSRIANSERYIICKNFKYGSSEKPYKKFHELFNLLSKIDMSKNYICKFFKFKIPYYFVNRIEECNAILGQQQIENINYTISIIETKKNNDKIEHIKKNNIQKCIAWCLKHGLAYNKNIGITNVFLAENVNLAPTDMSPAENTDEYSRQADRPNRFKTKLISICDSSYCRYIQSKCLFVSKLISTRYFFFAVWTIKFFFLFLLTFSQFLKHFLWKKMIACEGYFF